MWDELKETRAHTHLIGVNIAEIKFSAILQDVKSFSEDFELVGSQVDDAIGNDDVDRVGRHAGD